MTGEEIDADLERAMAQCQGQLDHLGNDFDDIPPSKSQWPGDESDPDSETEDEARTNGPFSLLLFAASKNRVDLYKSLKNEHGDKFKELLLERDEDGYSALHRAANSGSATIAQLLLKEDCVDVNAKTNDGWTPLHSASRWNQAEMAALLLSRGARVNETTNGGLTAIQLACSEKGYEQVISVLLAEPDIDVNSANEGGDSALILAERYCGLECMVSCRDNRL